MAEEIHEEEIARAQEIISRLNSGLIRVIPTMGMNYSPKDMPTHEKLNDFPTSIEKSAKQAHEQCASVSTVNRTIFDDIGEGAQTRFCYQASVLSTGQKSGLHDSPIVKSQCSKLA